MHGCYINKLEVTNQHPPFSHALTTGIMDIIAHSTYKKCYMITKYIILRKISMLGTPVGLDFTYCYKVQ